MPRKKKPDTTFDVKDLVNQLDVDGRKEIFRLLTEDHCVQLYYELGDLGDLLGLSVAQLDMTEAVQNG